MALDAWWVATYRHGFPLDVDEAGYMSIALDNYFALDAGGIHGWWHSIELQAPQAPLVPAVTSLILVFSQGIMQGFATLALFLVVLMLATYGIAERLAGPRLGALTAIVVGTLPGVFYNLREFIFALPVAALLACAVYALMRSESMQRSRWALACGVAIGLMLLSRTMSVAFVPGIGAAALLTIALRPREDWAIGILNLGVAAISAFAVAATWYWRNLDPVVEYLTEFGYGSHASEFGEHHSILSWDWWHAVATRITAFDLLVPMAALILVGLIALGVEVARRIATSDDRRTVVLGLLHSEVLAVGLVFAAGYFALSSSENVGSGFTLPITVLLAPISVVALRVHPRAVLPALALVALVTAVNVISTSTISGSLTRQRTVDVPGFGALPWVNGVPKAVAAIREQVPGPEWRFDDTDRAYNEVNYDLDRYIVDDLGTLPTVPVTIYGTRSRVLNTNSLTLETLQRYRGRVIPLAQVQPTPENAASEYVAQLEDPANGPPGVLVTTSPTTGDFEPIIEQRPMEEAARQAGFRLVRTFTVPFSTRVLVWQKQEP
ncbi:MAG TPA: glycosyltransferase family 39 protein [Solirubrobacterales bacterium]